MTDPNPGTVHTMEEEMRAAEQGVFEARSGEARRAKAAAETTPAKKTAKRKGK